MNVLFGAHESKNCPEKITFELFRQFVRDTAYFALLENYILMLKMLVCNICPEVDVIWLLPVKRYPSIREFKIKKYFFRREFKI